MKMTTIKALLSNQFVVLLLLLKQRKPSKFHASKLFHWIALLANNTATAVSLFKVLCRGSLLLLLLKHFICCRLNIYTVAMLFK